MHEHQVIGHVNLTWRGQPIYDAYAWARNRGEQMVRYDVWTAGLWGDTIYSHTEEVPESFFGNMRFCQDHRNIERFNP